MDGIRCVLIIEVLVRGESGHVVAFPSVAGHLLKRVSKGVAVDGALVTCYKWTVLRVL